MGQSGTVPRSCFALQSLFKIIHLILGFKNSSPGYYPSNIVPALLSPDSNAEEDPFESINLRDDVADDDDVTISLSVFVWTGGNIKLLSSTCNGVNSFSRMEPPFFVVSPTLSEIDRKSVV